MFATRPSLPSAPGITIGHPAWPGAAQHPGSSAPRPANPPQLVSARRFLQRVTRSAHERLHGHPTFAAAAAGTITTDDYQALLARLFGFHAAFEHLAGMPPARSLLLRQDLRSLGTADAEIERLPRCHTLPSLPTPASRLGARYVVEGSALGGRVIARALEPLFARNPARADGRRFFLGPAEAPGASWRNLLDELELGLRTRTDRHDAATTALAAFHTFEHWFAEPAGAAT